MLKNSAPKLRLTRSLTGVSFDSEISQLLMPCARRVGSTRGSLPRANGPGAAKHAGLRTEVPNVALVTIEPATDLLQPATTSGRIVPAPKREDKTFGAALVIARGNPLAKVVIPASFHPETSFSAMPVAFGR